MNFYCGTDIIEIERVKEAIENGGESFLNRVFTQNEIKYCESKKSVKYQHYAARFSAKEAVFKAISKFLDNKFDIGWKEVEIINDDSGRPEVKIYKKEIAEKLNVDISISHCKNYTTATAICFSQEN